MEKKLVRKNKKIFGVCGGLGNYFDLDPTLIRVGFLATFLMLGTGGLLYIILAVILPNET